MSTEVGVRKFKNDVSGYLARVEAGETVTVTKHGKPVARVVPADISPGMARLIAEGRVSWSGRPVKLPPRAKLTGRGKSAADYVSEGRR